MRLRHHQGNRIECCHWRIDLCRTRRLLCHQDGIALRLHTRIADGPCYQPLPRYQAPMPPINGDTSDFRRHLQVSAERVRKLHLPRSPALSLEHRGRTDENARHFAREVATLSLLAL